MRFGELFIVQSIVEKTESKQNCYDVKMRSDFY